MEVLETTTHEEALEMARKLKPLQKKLDAVVEKYKETAKENTARRKEVETVQEQHKQLATEVAALKSQLEEQQQRHEAELSSLKSQIQQQQEEEENKQQPSANANSQSEAIIQELKAKNSTLLDSVRDAHDNKTLALEREKEAKRSLEKAKKDMKTLDDSLKQTQATAQKEKADLEAKLAELRQRLESEQTHLESQRANAGVLEKQAEKSRLAILEQVDQLKAACVEKDSKQAASNQELAEVRSKLTQMERRQAKTLTMEQELVELRTKFEAVQASREQERLERTKERTRHQQELEMEREERVRERGAQEQAREKLALQRYEEIEKAHSKWEEQHARAVKSADTATQLSATVEELTRKLEKKTQELEEALGQGGAARQREAELAQEHQEAIKNLESKHNDKYQRLLREFKAYRERTTKLLEEQSTKLQSNAETISKLEEEITTGKPEERRMLQLAELQARRDVQIQHQDGELVRLREELASLTSGRRQLEEEKKALMEECKQLQTSRSRGEVNLDYLKNVLLRYFCAAEGSAERRDLTPAIAKILQFSPEETACLSQPGGGSWWSVFGAPSKVSLWTTPAADPPPPS